MVFFWCRVGTQFWFRTAWNVKVAFGFPLVFFVFWDKNQAVFGGNPSDFETVWKRPHTRTLLEAYLIDNVCSAGGQQVRARCTPTWHMVFWWTGECVWFQGRSFFCSIGALPWELITFPSDLAGRGRAVPGVYWESHRQENIVGKWCRMGIVKDWRWAAGYWITLTFSIMVSLARFLWRQSLGHKLSDVWGPICCRAGNHSNSLSSTQQAQEKSCQDSLHQGLREQGFTSEKGVFWGVACKNWIQLLSKHFPWKTSEGQILGGSG